MPIVGGQLGIWLAGGVDGDAWRYVDAKSGGNRLAANASALGHVSTKKLMGETQYGKFLTFRWSAPIPDQI